MQQLLISSVGNPEYPTPSANDTVEIYRGSSNQVSDIFNIYDGIAERGADIFFAGNINDFIEFDGNENYHVAVGNGANAQHLFISRILSDGVAVTSSTATDLIAVPDYHDGGIRYFQPKDIYVAENGHVPPNQVDNADRLYLGDDFMFGGGGGDDILRGGTGTNILDGGANTGFTSVSDSLRVMYDIIGDTVSYRGLSGTNGVYVNLFHSDAVNVGGSGVTLNENEGIAYNTSGGVIATDSLINIENIYDSSGDDILFGNASTNAFSYSGGNDYFYGGNGVDHYYISERPNAGEVLRIHESAANDPNYIYFLNGTIDFDNNVIVDEERILTYSNGGQIILSSDATGIAPPINLVGVDDRGDHTLNANANDSDTVTIHGGINKFQLDTRNFGSGGSGSGTRASSYSATSARNPVTDETEIDITLTYPGGSTIIISCTFDPRDAASNPNQSSEYGGVIVYVDAEPFLIVGEDGEVYDYPDEDEIAGLRVDEPLYNFLVGDGDLDGIFDADSFTPTLSDPENWDSVQNTSVQLSTDVETVYFAFLDAQNTGSPIVLDLDGDGIELIDKDSSTVFWDIDQDGFAELSGWVSPDDGLLALDGNNDGLITKHDELFGSVSGDGFTELLLLDSNTDGVIDANDVEFNNLVVWRDLNQNGIGGTSELFTLSQMNIDSINLNATVHSNLLLEGNTVTHISSYIYDDGVNTPESRDAYDVWFDYDNFHTLYDGGVVIDPLTFELPNFSGYGNLPSLQIAMSLDNDLSDPNSLLSLVRDLQSQNYLDLFDDGATDQLMRGIMLRWAGVDGVDPASRGAYFDARELEFIENFVAQDYLQGGASSNPGGMAGEAASRAFEYAVLPVIGRVISQIVAEELFEGTLTYNAFTDKFSDVTGLNQTALDALVAKSNDSGQVTDKTAFWLHVIKVIEHSIGIDNLGASAQSNLETAMQLSDASFSIADLVLKVQHDIDADLSWVVNGDTIYGTNGDDVYSGSVGDDLYSAGYGNDLLSGSLGDDLFYGGAHNDILNGQLGDDRLNGESGDDSYLLSAGHGDDKILDTSGNDKIIFDNTVDAGDLSFRRGNAFDVVIDIEADSGTGSVTVINQITSNGGAIETIEFSDGSTFDQNQIDHIAHGTGGNDNISGVAQGYGGSGNDTIYGYEGDDVLRGHATYGGYSYTTSNTIYGGEGNDTVNGDHGDDTLYGDAHNDGIYGLNGSDLIEGGTGNDYLRGEGGSDTYIFNYGDGLDTITEIYGDASIDRLAFGTGITQEMISLERVGANNLIIQIDGGSGGTIFLDKQINYSSYYVIEELSFADGTVINHFDEYILNGQNTGEWLYGATIGGGGIDTIYGNGGNDYIYGYYGSQGSNENNLYGGDGADSLYGENGNDFLSGGNDNDHIYGYGGDDIITGGNGIDTIYGHGGADTFVFDDASASDTIWDFKLSDSDKLDISDLLSGYDPLADALTDFVQITDNGVHSTLAVDIDGNADSFVNIATLYYATGLTDEEGLEASGTLITV